MYSGWCSVQEEMQARCEEQDSFLSLFNSDTANLIAVHSILSIKVDCNCTHTTAAVSGSGLSGMSSSSASGLASATASSLLGVGGGSNRDSKDPSHGIAAPFSVSMETESQVAWIMQVVNYALTMPFNYWEVVKHSAHIYCCWLRCLTPSHKSTATGGKLQSSPGEDSAAGAHIPLAIRRDPNRYAQAMLLSLCRLFMPRLWRSGAQGVDRKEDFGSPELQQQPVVLHQVLRTIEEIASESRIINTETWECLLQFCLAVNHIMLAPPPEPVSMLRSFSLDDSLKKDDLSTKMADRMVGVMFSVWLQACHRCFPRPPLWRTFAEMCRAWRHHAPLVHQWNRVNSALTARLLKILYGTEFPDLPALDEHTQRLVPRALSDECVKECWFRFLHLLGNPVDLCHPKTIAQTDEFAEYSSGNRYMGPNRCLQALHHLPAIFLDAMRGVAVLTDAFLGLQPSPAASAAAFLSFASGHGHLHDKAQTSPTETRRNVSGSNASATGGGQGSLATTGGVGRSVAALSTASIDKSMKKTKTTGGQPSSQSVGTTSQSTRAIQSSPPGVTIESISSAHPLRPEGNSLLHLFGAWLFEAAVTGVQLEMDDAVISTRSSLADGTANQVGRAEACGALCRIFSNSQRDGVLDNVYLARFYMCMHYGLATENGKCSSYVLSTILFNSTNLLRVDLEGVNILVPRLLVAVAYVLKADQDKNLERPEYMSAVQLRRAAIHQLLCVIALPLQFKGLTIKSLLPVINDAEDPVPFYELKKRISVQLSDSLNAERDPVNLQMLLGGMLCLLEDLAAEEIADSSMTGNEEVHGHKIDHSHPPSLETASGLFSHALGQVCIKVVHVWKNDLSTVLFALEVLCGISNIKIKHPDKAICKRSVRFICEFIVNQCNRDPKDHSRLLHSIIVAAFHCLSLWLVRHSYLLNDPDCLQCVLETAELGISGSKSKIMTGTSEHVRLKAGKLMPNPTSKRVKDAAESLLACLMEQADAFPTPTGPESLCTLLKEDTLIKYCRSSKEDALHFRYFWVEPGLILGLLEQPLGNSEDCLPTVTAVIRGPFGRHAWTMQLRQLPRNRTTGSSVTAHTLVNPSQESSSTITSDSLVLGEASFVSRPKPAGVPGSQTDTDNRPTPVYFPDSTLTVQKTKADESIPDLETVAQQECVRKEVDLLKTIIRQQTQFVNDVGDRVRKERASAPYPNPETDCKQPKRIPMPTTSACHEFQTARLILTHLGYLSVNAWLYDPQADRSGLSNKIGDVGSPSSTGSGCMSDTSVGSGPSTAGGNLTSGSCGNTGGAGSSRGGGGHLAGLYSLDSSTSQFFEHLDQLDELPTRTADTSYIYYVRHGETSPVDILANADNYASLSADFHDFLRSLGWPVVVGEHAGWTGDPDTSYQLNQGRGGRYSSPSTPQNYQGDQERAGGSRSILYWADMSAEVAFLMPARVNFPSLVVGESALRQRTHTAPATLVGGDEAGEFSAGLRTVLIWLEDQEDLERFPMNQLASPDAFFIFMHPLKTGLYRIHLHRLQGRLQECGAGPLVSGMVVSRRCLGSLVRQTVINANRRRRLESDHFQPPHVRRAQKIHEVMTRHRMQDHSLPDLFTSLLHQPISTTEPRF